MDSLLTPEQLEFQYSKCVPVVARQIKGHIAALEAKHAREMAEAAEDHDRDVAVLIKAHDERDAALRAEYAATMRRHDEDSAAERMRLIEQVEERGREIAELGEQLEHDRSLVAACVTKATEAVRSRNWLTEGRCPYEWNDDNWHQEFAAAASEFIESIEPMRKVAADWSSCPKSGEEIAKARIDLKAELARIRSEAAKLGHEADCASHGKCVACGSPQTANPLDVCFAVGFHQYKRCNCAQSRIQEGR